MRRTLTALALVAFSGASLAQQQELDDWLEQDEPYAMLYEVDKLTAEQKQTKAQDLVARIGDMLVEVLRMKQVLFGTPGSGPKIKCLREAEIDIKGTLKTATHSLRRLEEELSYADSPSEADHTYVVIVLAWQKAAEYAALANACAGEGRDSAEGSSDDATEQVEDIPPTYDEGQDHEVDEDVREFDNDIATDPPIFKRPDDVSRFL